jgi:hypothetical protein
LSERVEPAGTLQQVRTGTGIQAAFYAAAVSVHVSEENVGWKT